MRIGGQIDASLGFDVQKALLNRRSIYIEA